MQTIQELFETEGHTPRGGREQSLYRSTTRQCLAGPSRGGGGRVRPSAGPGRGGAATRLATCSEPFAGQVLLWRWHRPARGQRDQLAGGGAIPTSRVFPAAARAGSENCPASPEIVRGRSPPLLDDWVHALTAAAARPGGSQKKSLLLGPNEERSAGKDNGHREPGPGARFWGGATRGVLLSVSGHDRAAPCGPPTGWSRSLAPGGLVRSGKRTPGLPAR